MTDLPSDSDLNDAPIVSRPGDPVLADEVAKAIRGAIFSGRLRLGERLFEEKLASNFKVSRGPVREALVTLAHEGLVRAERYKGATVTELGVSQVDELHSLRAALERLALQSVCLNANGDDFDSVASVLQRCDDAVPPLGGPSVAWLEVSFHDALFRSAHHERLYGAWLSLRCPIFLLLLRRAGMGGDVATSWRNDHVYLLDLVVQRRHAVAARMMEHHLQRVREIVSRG